jgi:transcription elongation GreA/GreB family factor
MRLPTRKKELERMQTEEFDVYVTKEKLQRMHMEVMRLESKERGDAAAEVARTAEMGDLSENAGYQWAKQHLRQINGRILRLKERINRAIVIDQENTDGIIRIGSTVRVRVNNREYTYQILGSQETNPGLGRISHHSPIGQALLGHRSGDIIDVVRDGSTIAYHVLAVH